MALNYSYGSIIRTKGARQTSVCGQSSEALRRIIVAQRRQKAETRRKETKLDRSSERHDRRCTTTFLHLRTGTLSRDQRIWGHDRRIFERVRDRETVVSIIIIAWS